MFRRPLLLFWLLGLVMAAPALAGCNVIGFAAGQTMAPPKRPAAFDLRKQPTSVTVNVNAALSGTLGPLDAEVVAVSTERTLERRGKVPVTMEADAQRRIYVELLPPISESVLGSDLRQGGAVARVRVLDDQGQELWPRDGSAGVTVEALLPPARHRSEADLRRATLRSLGERVGALFYPSELRS